MNNEFVPESVDFDDEEDEFCVAGETVWIPCKTPPETISDEDDEDEFSVPGETVLIPIRPKTTARSNLSSIDDDEEDEFCIHGQSVEIPVKQKQVNPIKKTRSEDRLPADWDNISTDSEYIPHPNEPTIPLTVQFASGGQHKEYLHPNHPLNKYQLADIRHQLKKLGESDALKVFESPLAILDYLQDAFGIKWRHAPDPNRRRYVKTLKLYIFHSFKDIEFQFAATDDYVFFVLPKLERIRRITTRFNRPIALPYEILLPGNGFQWYSVSIEIVDISAMQGAKSLKTYMSNVGMPTSDKEAYKPSQKARMDIQMVENTKKFLEYIRSDVQLLEVYKRTIKFYNTVAEKLGVKPRENWGLSTGKIVANIVSDWIANDANVPVKDTTDEETKKPLPGMYQYNRLSTPEAIKLLSHLAGIRNLLYLGMTDGGRCIKERPTIDRLIGVLIDIDIRACYATSLMHQIFPIGNPKIFIKAMKFSEWEKKFSKRLIPGLWVARVSWEDAPFKQDILISKEDKQFTAWDFYQRLYNETTASDAERIYDASMYLMTNTVRHASLNHDLYQVLQKYTSPQELKWIRENATVESFAMYAANEEVDTLDEGLLLLDSIDDLKSSGLRWNTSWKRVELKKLMKKLIALRMTHKNMVELYRKRYGKLIPEVDKVTYQNLEELEPALKHWVENEQLTLTDALGQISYTFTQSDYSFHASIQEFIKLISNTIYGCIASAFFGTDGTGISNFVVGNNITARARALAWTMAKGLHMIITVTDGGIFDCNKVLSYRRKSLDIFANVANEQLTDSSRHKVVEVIPLYGKEIPFDENINVVLGNGDLPHVADKAWEHLKDVFPELDIFKYDQFGFEVKSVYTSCEIRNKSDYILRNEFKNSSIAKIRGLQQMKDEDNPNNDNCTDPIVLAIFEDIKTQTPNAHEQENKRRLGLNEWRNRENLQKELLPHDDITSKKVFYSLTPLGVRFINPEHRKAILHLYDRLRIEEKKEDIAQLRALESLENWEEFKAANAKSKKRKTN
jgi:hypothetical protein